MAKRKIFTVGILSAIAVLATFIGAFLKRKGKK